MPDIITALQKGSVAVVRTDRLGDMVLTLPLCQALKNEFPFCHLTLIARRYIAPLLENCPVVDHVLFIEDYEKGLNDIFKSHSFDLAFFPRPRFKEVYSAFLHKVKFRIGSAYRLYSFLFNKRIKDHRKKGKYHEAEYNVRMLGSIINKQIPTSLVKPILNPEANVYVSDILKEHNVPSNKYIILHPGSGGSTPVWRPEKFAVLAGLMLAKTDFSIIVTGTEGESLDCETVSVKDEKIVNLCGKLDLSAMIGLIAGAKLVVANGTGILHVAAACGVPVVGLFPNVPGISPVRWRPYSTNSISITPAATQDNDLSNMELIEPQTVYDASMKLLIE